jgi:C1A family cysteine protease
VLIFGWDDDVAAGSLLVRNSWGDYLGSTNGNFYAPYARYLPSLWECWKACDVITRPVGPR